MTIPWLMNCGHSETGWCLNCVAAMGAELSALKARPEERPSFNQVRDAIVVRMCGHTMPFEWAKQWDTFLSLLRQVKASECALPKPSPMNCDGDKRG